MVEHIGVSCVPAAAVVELAQPLHRSVRGRPAPELPRVMISQREEDCSLLGAAVLPIHELLSSRLQVLQKDDLGEVQAAELLGHLPASYLIKLPLDIFSDSAESGCL